jgi:hypothetical protein
MAEGIPINRNQISVIMKNLKVIGTLIVLYACFAVTTAQVSTTKQENLSPNFQSNERI